MIHMLRQLTKNDEKWRKILRKMNANFYHQTVTTQQIETFLSKEIGLKLNPFFNQYLRDTRIPVLEYSIENNVLFYRWNNVVDGFDMPVEIKSNNEIQWLYPTESWQTTIVKSPKITIDEDYYISIKNLNQ